MLFSLWNFLFIICINWTFLKSCSIELQILFKSYFPIPESYQQIWNLERLGAKIPSTILTYFQYHTELTSWELQTVTTWTLCGSYSINHFNIEDRAYMVIACSLYVYISHSRTRISGFAQPFILLNFTKSNGDTLMSFCKPLSHFVLLSRPAFWKKDHNPLVENPCKNLHCTEAHKVFNVSRQ